MLDRDRERRQRDAGVSAALHERLESARKAHVTKVKARQNAAAETMQRLLKQRLESHRRKASEKEGRSRDAIAEKHLIHELMVAEKKRRADEGAERVLAANAAFEAKREEQEEVAARRALGGGARAAEAGGRVALSRARRDPPTRVARARRDRGGQGSIGDPRRG